MPGVKSLPLLKLTLGEPVIEIELGIVKVTMVSQETLPLPLLEQSVALAFGAKLKPITAKKLAKVSELKVKNFALIAVWCLL